MLQVMCLQQQVISDKPTLYETWCMIYLRLFTCNALCVHILMNVYMPSHLVQYVPTTNSSISGHIVHLVHLMCTFSIMCSNTWNSVLPQRTQKHFSFSLCWSPSYASTSACTLLARYLMYTLCIFFHSTACCRTHSNIWARL